MTPDIRKFIDDSREVCEALLVESKECIDSGVDLITVECKVVTDWSAALDIIERQAMEIERVWDERMSFGKRIDEVDAENTLLRAKIYRLERADLDLRIAKNQALND